MLYMQNAVIVRPGDHPQWRNISVQTTGGHQMSSVCHELDLHCLIWKRRYIMKGIECVTYWRYTKSRSGSIWQLWPGLVGYTRWTSNGTRYWSDIYIIHHTLCISHCRYIRSRSGSSGNCQVWLDIPDGPVMAPDFDLMCLYYITHSSPHIVCFYCWIKQSKSSSWCIELAK
jgi:hypothetical protein